MKIGTVQLNYTIADVENSVKKAEDAILTCERDGADLIVLTELLPTGYPPKDLLYREDLIERNLQARNHLVAITSKIKAAIAFGYVEPNPNPGGKPFFNAACIAQRGSIVKTRHKVLLPTYDVFSEDRYFEPGENDFAPVEIAGVKIGLVICEEIWNREKKLYAVDPVAESVRQGAQHLIVVNASPYSQGVVETRHELVKDHCLAHNVGMTYVNQVGYNDNVGFDGDSFAMNRNGEIIFHAPMFRENVEVYSTDNQPIPSSVWEREWQQEIVEALTTGIGDYLNKNKITGPGIVCNSGGIDSAMVLYLGTRALGAKRMLSISLPSEFSSDHSLSDAEKLAKSLGVKHITIPIKDIHNAIRAYLDIGFAQIYSDGNGKTDGKDHFGMPMVLTKDAGVVDENIQARIRGLVGMAYANRFRGLVLSTSNKSEAAVGYTTLYGDMCGGLSVIGDVLKTDVYAIANWLNSTYRSEVIPKHTIAKLPSAELSPGQFDQQSLPPYELLDAVLRLMVHNHNSPRQIKKALLNEESAIAYLSKYDRSMEKDIEKVILLTIAAEQKRQQSPTALRVSQKLFKAGWEMPIAHALRL